MKATCSIAVIMLFSSIAFKNSLSCSSKQTSKSMALGAEATVEDLPILSIKEALGAICGPKESIEESLLFPEVAIQKQAPGPTKYIIANPKTFLQKPQVAKLYGLDLKDIKPSTKLTTLAHQLPVIYIADVHPEYGTVGFALNKESTDSKMSEKHAGLKSFRDRAIYLGGADKRGSSFTMVHQKAGFPENRAWKQIPTKNGEKSPPLFFSPDLAMANELCLTNDAKPEDFKFFEWATVWSPGQLAYEYEQQLWITVEAPVNALFSDEAISKPLWKRLVCSLPTGIIKFPQKNLD